MEDRKQLLPVTRPIARNNDDNERVLNWPSNELFYWKSPAEDNDLVLFLGTEPNLKWRTYTQTLLNAVTDYDIELFVKLGSLLDALPHTREPILSGGANKSEVMENLDGLRAMGSGYQGPVGITSAFMDACTKRDLGYASIWAHAPHYVQRAPNYKVTKALISQVNNTFGTDLPLQRLEERGRAFETEVTKAIASNVDVSTYVKRLERQYDEAASGNPSALPTPESMADEVEDFFRRERPGEGFSSN